ncbi:MAG TPA: dihydrofolate reductase family protein [Polyangiaceae bacterium]|nr:dihydrofolate reductase family protein [Polyangiaceae bacterium]
MTQRSIVTYTQVSADGFFADPEGGLDWVVSDPEVHARAVQGMPHTDLMLFGRKTYEMFAGFWPNALENLEQAGPHGSRKRDPAFAAMAHWLNDTKKLVASRSLPRAHWSNSELCRDFDAAKVRQLKQSSGKGILVFGSSSVVSQLAEWGVVDEYRFLVCPVLLGKGRTLLGNTSQRLALELVESQSFPSGNVLLSYRPRR